VVCGGDGTVGWSLEDLDKCKKEGSVKTDQTFAVLPLGTGNDMARTLKFGGGYQGEKLIPILKSAALSNTTALDRWRVTMQVSGPKPSTLNPQPSTLP
jgi:diacylglycerol kinase (ATP)